VVYKVDYFVFGTLLSSFVLLNTKVVFYLYSRTVRHSSHWGGSLQNRLRDEQTCGTTLASAYVLRHLSAAWSQLWMLEKSPRWE